MRLRAASVLALAITVPAPAIALGQAPAVEPAPGPSGWHRGPVTSGSVTVQEEGTHTIEHPAGDGRPARAVHLRIDRTAPQLSLEVRDRRADAVAIGATAQDALAGAARLEWRVDRGRWRARALDEELFDGSAASLESWRHAGAGSFETTPDGALRTVGGLGLLWFAERAFADAAFRLQWRDARPDGERSNGGVFVRFPAPTAPERPLPCDVLLPPALFDAAWHAVACGHELQINDGDVDPQRTGSVYGFRPLDAEAARVRPPGSWNDFEVRTTGAGSYEVTVVRNGHVLNRFVNTPGQRPVPGAEPASIPRLLYPPTDVKQFAAGHFGLQNHGDADTIEYRDVRALPLGPREATFTVRRAARRRVVRVRAVDAAGNRSAPTTLRLAARR